jgi:methylated-DNA-[protein]-cysteine S-methyltransferase
MANATPTFFIYKTPFCPITIAAEGGFITHLSLGQSSFLGIEKPTETTNNAANQLQEYFAGKRTFFDIALAPKGSGFQKQVWEALQNIPYGQTRSYLDIAEAIGNPRASRAVGNANNKNPIPIIIPCHRVVLSNGKLGGYALGTKIKQDLLDLERAKR